MKYLYMILLALSMGVQATDPRFPSKDPYLSSGTVQANNDFYKIRAGRTTIIPAWMGVLANDTEMNGQLLVAELAFQPEHATVTMAPDGSLYITPEFDFVGEVSFAYAAYPHGDRGNKAVAGVTLYIAR